MHGLSCSVACGIFSDQKSNLRVWGFGPCLLLLPRGAQRWLPCISQARIIARPIQQEFHIILTLGRFPRNPPVVETVFTSQVWGRREKVFEGHL